MWVESAECAVLNLIYMLAMISMMMIRQRGKKHTLSHHLRH
jgi:hypothetical protein